MVEETPKTENKYTELSDDEKKEEYEKIIASFSNDLKDKLIPKKEEKKEVKAEAVEVPKTPSEKKVSAYLKPLDDQTELIAQTLMSDKIDEVKTVYKDYDTSGIVNDESINTLQKVKLITTEALPNARKMANIEKNLKDNSEGTQKDGKTDPKKSPEKAGDGVDKEAGQKLLTQMFEDMGLEEEETKSEGKKTD